MKDMIIEFNERQNKIIEALKEKALRDSELLNLVELHMAKNTYYKERNYLIEIERIIHDKKHTKLLYLPEYNDASDEARFFVKKAKKYLTSGYLRPALDIEDDENENSYPYRMGWEPLSNWIHEFVNTVISMTGVEPIIYVDSYYANNLDSSLEQYDLWIAHWHCDTEISPNTGIWDKWTFWQYYGPKVCGENFVPGINGGVDINLFAGDMVELENYII